MNKLLQFPRGLIGIGMFLCCLPLLAADPAVTATTPAPADYLRAVGLGWAAALAIAFSALGAAYAVGKIGSAALGAAAEKPELLNRSIVFVALAEGLAILGFAIAMILLQKI
jgi:V/A-type H+-transporting ATPase subunit K